MNSKHKTITMRVPTLPDDGAHEYMLVGRHGWGRGATIDEALRIYKSNESDPPLKLLIVPKGAIVNEMGNAVLWTDNEAHPPRGKCRHCLIY